MLFALWGESFGSKKHNHNSNNIYNTVLPISSNNLVLILQP